MARIRTRFAVIFVAALGLSSKPASAEDRFATLRTCADNASHVEQRECLETKMKESLAGRRQLWWLWQRQGGKCPGCGQPLGEDQPWQLHHRIRRSLGGNDGLDNLEVRHANCHRQLHSNESEMDLDRVSQEAFERLEPDAL